ncbi:OsmC family protein [Vibrio nigripulchritudo]|uniref:OsmC family protein n=1 Tax=Vibrio nigripulchritudo TaxID=28173 RepID=UPI0005F9F994|nr:OsmC family protein [Vibrio nigripulchritudo]KJY76292.1 osmotically inducible protein OsmC [Vibrio nigripulchritudo]
MKAEVKWVDGFKFIGTSESGHSMVMDGSGGKHAPSPMEAVLMASGGCSSVDVIDGLKSANQNVTDCIAELTTERRDEAPKLFTKIHIHFKVTGHELDESQVEKVVFDSLQKYCSVCLMLGAGVEMSHSYEVIRA